MDFKKLINNDQQGNATNAPHIPRGPVSQPAAPPASVTPSAAPAAAVGNGASAHRNRLSSDVEINGTIRFQDELIVDGKVEGEIISTGALHIRENARIKATVKVGSVIIHGKVHGNITASGSVEMKVGSEVVGDIKATTLVMEGGAIFVGKSEIGIPSSQPARDQKSASDANKASAPQQKPAENKAATPEVKPQGKPVGAA